MLIQPLRSNTNPIGQYTKPMTYPGLCEKCGGRYLPESKGKYVCPSCGFRPLELGPRPQYHTVFGAPDLRRNVSTASKTTLGLQTCSLIFEVKGGRKKTYTLGTVQVKIHWLCEENNKNNRHKVTNYPLGIEILGTLPSSFNFDWHLYPAKDIAQVINESFKAKTGNNLDYLIAWINDEKEEYDNFAKKISQGG